MPDIPLQDLPQFIERRMTEDLSVRVERAMLFLVQEIKKAYVKKLKAGRGEAGAIGALTYQVKKSRGFLDATIGTSKAGSYLANLEFGEKGTLSSPAGALFTRKKAPPLRNIYQWIKRAKLKINDSYIERALANEKRGRSRKKTKLKFDASKPWWSNDPQMLLAYDIAMKIKRRGRAGLRIIEATANAHAAKISKFLEEESS